MFGILWGVISVVDPLGHGRGLPAGQRARPAGARQERRHRLGRPHVHAGRRRAGGHAGRADGSTTPRALASESAMIAVVSPEIQRGGITVKSAYNAAALSVHGIEPQYQQIRTLDIERGRPLSWQDEKQVRRVAIIGADIDQAAVRRPQQRRGSAVPLNGTAVHGRRQDPAEGPGQQLQRSGQRQGVRAVLGDGAGLSRAWTRRSRRRCPDIIVAPGRGWSTNCRRARPPDGPHRDIDWPLEAEMRRVLAPRTGVRPGRPGRHRGVGHVARIAACSAA